MEIHRSRLNSILYPLGTYATVVIATCLAVHGAIVGTGNNGWNMHPYFALPIMPLIAAFSSGACARGIGKVACKRSTGLTAAILLSLFSSWGISFLLFGYINRQ